jgi:hypothetical protein
MKFAKDRIKKGIKESCCFSELSLSERETTLVVELVVKTKDW